MVKAAAWLAALGATGLFIERNWRGGALFWISLALVGVAAILAFSALPFGDED